jgi:hypothetical protein
MGRPGTKHGIVEIWRQKENAVRKEKKMGRGREGRRSITMGSAENVDGRCVRMTLAASNGVDGWRLDINNGMD